jgi:hypothetical protein
MPHLWPFAGLEKITIRRQGSGLVGEVIYRAITRTGRRDRSARAAGVRNFHPFSFVPRTQINLFGMRIAMPILLWLLGVPLSVVIVLWLVNVI